jgi:hypothetical protein
MLLIKNNRGCFIGLGTLQVCMGFIGLGKACVTLSKNQARLLFLMTLAFLHYIIRFILNKFIIITFK